MAVKKRGQKGWMSHRQAVDRAVTGHRRAAFRDGRAGRIDMEEAQDRIEDAERRRRRVWWFRR